MDVSVVVVLTLQFGLLAVSRTDDGSLLATCSRIGDTVADADNSLQFPLLAVCGTGDSSLQFKLTWDRSDVRSIEFELTCDRVGDILADADNSLQFPLLGVCRIDNTSLIFELTCGRICVEISLQSALAVCVRRSDEGSLKFELTCDRIGDTVADISLKFPLLSICRTDNASLIFELTCRRICVDVSLQFALAVCVR